MRGERIAAPMLALLIVFSGAGGAIAPGASPVGTAEAQLGDGSGGACQTSDWFLTFISGTLLTTDCKTAGDVSEEWNETDAIQTRTQIHSQGGQLEVGNEQYLVGMSNSLTDSNTVAFSKGEAAAVEVLANGGNVSEAQAAANESIGDYYTVKDLNVLDRSEVGIETVATLNQRAENTTDVSSDFVTVGPEDSFGESFNQSIDYTSIDKSVILGKGDTRTVTLPNGSTQIVDTLRVRVHFTYSGQSNTITYDWGPGGIEEVSSNSNLDLTEHPEEWRVSKTASGETGSLNLTHIHVRPTENLSSKTVFSIEEFGGERSNIRDRANATKEEVAVYVNQSLGPAVENGELNATSYVSPATLAQEYAQSYNGSKSYIRATAIATYSGMDAPSLEETGSMTVTHDGETYEGLLLSQEAPSGGWQSGEQYDPALLSGLQMFAVAGENGSIVELDGPFTVDKVTGTDGEEISKATTVNVTYQTSNESANYTELQQQIRSLNEKIEERQVQATTGGSDTTTNDGLLAKLSALLGVSSGIAVVIVAGVGYVAYRVYVPDP